MHRFTTHGLALALLAWAATDSACAESFKSLEPHVLYEATSGKSDEAAVYETVGLAGERMVIEVRSPTNVEVTAHTFRGEPMLSQSGRGTISLEVVLPLDDIYFVSVLREVPANAFTIRRSREGDLPDPYLAAFADGVGFQNESYSSCWVIPGLLKKVVFQKSSKEVGLVGQGREYEEAFYDNGTVESSVRRRRIVSEDKSIVTVHHNGKVSYEFEEIRSQWKTKLQTHYWRYQCE